MSWYPGKERLESWDPPEPVVFGDEGIEECPDCDGMGYTIEDTGGRYEPDGAVRAWDRATCRRCEGEGWIEAP